MCTVHPVNKFDSGTGAILHRFDGNVCICCSTLADFVLFCPRTVGTWGATVQGPICHEPSSSIEETVHCAVPVFVLTT